MKKILGILLLLIIVSAVTTFVEPQFSTPLNLENLIRRAALIGIISIGVSFVIITGGIDLSIGSVIGLTGILLAQFLSVSYETASVELSVRSINAEARVVQLTGDDVPIRRDDRLQYANSSGREQRLTVVSSQPRDGGVEVEVRESVGQLRAGMPIAIGMRQHMNVALAVALVLLVSLVIGLTHGLLVTKLKLQPFVVTLCGLLVYRGLAREIAKDEVLGFGTGFEGLKFLASGKPFSVPMPFLQWIHAGNWSRVKWDYQAGAPAADASGYTIPLDIWDWVAVPMPALILLVLAILGIIFLNFSIYGRYLLALGANEQAARYSGINTDRMVIVAYVICSMLAGLAGILFALELNSVQPAGQGNFYELYAIAAAVLGGCSLRGGEGSIIGVVIGAGVMRMLQNSIVLMGMSNRLEFAIIGIVILVAVVVDELVKRYAARRRARREAAHAEKAGAPP